MSDANCHCLTSVKRCHFYGTSIAYCEVTSEKRSSS